MLCELARSFPPQVARFMERDRGLKRNFREESITDILMSSLIGLQPFGIRVDFPHEPTTGADMDWIFVAPLEIGGGRYLRLILQAKRAQFAKSKKGGYWYYHHLDHEKGKQAQTLVSYAGSSPDGMSTLPLYVFYHPTSALLRKTKTRPAVEGINLVFAHQIAPVVAGGCKRENKRVDTWRDSFMPLSDILCWPVALRARRAAPDPSSTSFMVGSTVVATPPFAGGFHPDIVSGRLENRLERSRGKVPIAGTVRRGITPTDGIPAEIQRAIDGNMTEADRKELPRPRVIFSTTMTHDNPAFVEMMRRASQ